MQGFKPMVRESDYDASELAIVTFLQAKAFGKPWWRCRRSCWAASSTT